MTQMTAKVGIKKHGGTAIDALYQEFMQHFLRDDESVNSYGNKSEEHYGRSA
jgi:hypothetical protein